MDEKTLTALRASIEKWRGYATTTPMEDIRLTISSCPLCVLYRLKSPYCRGCPVFEKTGEACCCGTPFEAAEAAHDEWYFAILEEREMQSDEAAFRAAAKAEFEFLESLLPEPAK